MKKTAIVLVGLASSTAIASAAPKLAAEESTSATASDARSVSAVATQLPEQPQPSPDDDFDGWLAHNYGAPTAATTRDPYTIAANLRRTTERTITSATRALEIASGAIVPVVARLLAPAVKKTPKEPVAYPLTDERGDIACANVATKGGSERKCYDRSGMRVALDSVAYDD